MPRVEKTVFISYRRTNVAWALAVFQHLTHHGFDVFFDYMGIASGDFEQVIIENIRSRAHFLVLLTPSALERCAEPGDWFQWFSVPGRGFVGLAVRKSGMQFDTMAQTGSVRRRW